MSRSGEFQRPSRDLLFRVVESLTEMGSWEAGPIQPRDISTRRALPGRKKTALHVGLLRLRLSNEDMTVVSRTMARPRMLGWNAPRSAGRVWTKMV